MVFSSLEFIFIFLPIVVILCIILPTKYKNLVIFIASLLFYFYGVSNNIIYLILFVLAIIINFILGKKIYLYKIKEDKLIEHYISVNRKKKAENIKKKSKAFKLLRYGIIYNLGILFVFKYLDFFIRTTMSILNIPYTQHMNNIKLLHLVLPIGISFYTFQACSYIIDVYKNNIKPAKTLINFGTYISLFPQLIAGPIVKYDQVSIDIKKKNKIKLINLSSGVKIFIIGLFLKVIIANRLGGLWNSVLKIGYDSISTQLAWMSMIGRSFQIYFDFFGYSLMAIGLGMMLGFKFPHNFNHPFMSCSISEFWRRWHITLGMWFKEYIYIPLGGNRCSTIKTIRNLFIVWAFTGLWHGANLNFILWGISLFIFVVIEKFFIRNFLNKHKIFGRIYTFVVANLTFTIFSITEISQIKIFYSRLFPLFIHSSGNIFIHDYIKYGQQYGLYLALAFILSDEYLFKVFNKYKNTFIGSIIIIIMFALSVYEMYIGLDNPFLYFRF